MDMVYSSIFFYANIGCSIGKWQRKYYAKSERISAIMMLDKYLNELLFDEGFISHHTKLNLFIILNELSSY